MPAEMRIRESELKVTNMFGAPAQKFRGGKTPLGSVRVASERSPGKARDRPLFITCSELQNK